MNGIGDLKKKLLLEVYIICKFIFMLLCLWGIFFSVKYNCNVGEFFFIYFK